MSGRRNIDTTETIFALASGSLPSAVAILKLSGKDAFSIAEKIVVPREGKLERARGMVFGEIKTLEGELVDNALILTFVGPNSHTGEDTIEFHCHGSLAINRRLESLLLFLGARPAERGEFSYRAFLNGKVEPSELETLGDLYGAHEERDLDRIYGRRDGSLGRRISELREGLIRTQAILDTAVDFSEEYANAVSQVRTPILLTIRECSEIIQRYALFKGGRNTPRMVLVGRPNVGKSSLFNALLGRYRAIVNSEPGTTRDVVEEEVDLNGRRWKLVDTAGVRDSGGAIEREGMALGEDYLAAADLWILVVDGSEGLKAEEARLLEKYRHRPHLVVWNKSDLTPNPVVPSWMATASLVSAKEGRGIEELWERMKSIAPTLQPSHEGLLPTGTQAVRLEGALRSLDELMADLGKFPPEYLAEKNRQAVRSLESVIGEVSADDVLDRVFSEFCIGK